MSKFVLLALVVILQVCLTTADTEPNPTESQGVLERARNAYKVWKSKVVDVGSTAAEFVQMYYDDQVKPVTEPYVDWAKERARSFWEAIKDKVSSDGSA